MEEIIKSSTSIQIASYEFRGDKVLITLSEHDHFDGGIHSTPELDQVCVFENETVGNIVSIDRNVFKAHVIHVIPYNEHQNIKDAVIVGQMICCYSILRLFN